MIVDDEELFREGMAMDVDWESCDMELAGLAEDGRKALKMIERIHPDIVVTDIRMPKMNGLELIEQARSIYKDLQFIILTGHDEFEYAQKAVRLGVCDFLLKPLDEGDLEKLLLQQKNRILEERKALRERDIRNAFLLVSPSENNHRDDWNGIIVVKYEESSSPVPGEEDFFSAVQRVVSPLTYASILENRSSAMVICVTASERAILEEKTSYLIRSLRIDRELKEHFSFSLGIGSFHQGTDQLNRSFDEARRSLNQSFIEGRNKTYYFDDLEEARLEGSFDRSGLEYGDLLYALRTGDRESMHDSLNLLIKNTALMGKDSFAYGLLVVGNVFTEALKIIEESGSSSSGLLGNPMAVYERITSCQTLEEMFRQLRSSLDTLIEHQALKRSGGNSLLLDNIKAYIRLHYSDPNLSLQQTAEHFHISQGHLCSVFSSASESTFKEYLTEVRIRKACELILSSHMMVYEIAEKVGYNNPTYFNSVFKKAMGITPLQFKKNRMKKS